nr:DNA helicase [Tanacetum cinerariifolium]
MNDRRCFEALDRSLKDICNKPDTSFGSDPDETDDEDTFTVQMPTELCILDSDTALTTLISFIYDEKTLQTPTPTDLQKKAIVFPKNENADMINAQVLSLVNSQQHVYLSLDEAMPHGNDEGATELLYPLEYLNLLNFANFPSHRLELKVGAPIILLRNLNISGGLCNETRLIVTQLLSKVIEARIITGTRISKKVFLPRIPLINRDLNLPFIFKRKQFPIKLCYAMTINKSQGQSLERICIFLPEPGFAQGQLYVALSRATSPNGLKILIKHPTYATDGMTKNIFYRDFLATVAIVQDDHDNAHDHGHWKVFPNIYHLQALRFCDLAMTKDKGETSTRVVEMCSICLVEFEEEDEIQFVAHLI